MNKTEIFELWKGRISDKRIQMDNIDSTKGVKRYKAYYRGDYTSTLGEMKVPLTIVNEVYSFVRTAVSILFSRNPKIKCNPRRKQDILPAKIAEIAINYYWQIKKIKRQVKKCIKEAKLCGYSWMKVGYEIITESTTDEKEQVNEFIKNEDIYAVYVPYNAVWYDSDAQDPPYDCRWMIHRYLRPTEVLRKKYGNNMIQANQTLETKSGELKETDKERTFVYEIWDKDSEKIFYYVEGVNDFVDVKDWPDGFIGFPFVMLTFDEIINLDNGDNIACPEIAAFESQILEKIKIRSLQMEHIKRYNRQVAYDINKVGEEEKQKILRGEVASLIGVEGSPDGVFGSIPYPPIQADIYQIENRIDIDRDKISGQSSLEQGAPVSTKTRTLGEIEEITRGTQGRSAEQQDMVEDFAESIATKLLQLMRTYLSKEQYARITGDIEASVVDMLSGRGLLDGLSIKYTNAQLQGMYDVSIVSGSTLPLSPTNRLNNLINIAKVGQAFGLTPGSMASIQLGKDIMAEMEMKEMAVAFELDVQRMLQPKTPTPQEQMKLMQMQQSLQKGGKQLEVMDNRMASNTQSTIKKAMDNAQRMDGELSDIDKAQKKINLIKAGKELASNNQEAPDNAM